MYNRRRGFYGNPSRVYESYTMEHHPSLGPFGMEHFGSLSTEFEEDYEHDQEVLPFHRLDQLNRAYERQNRADAVLGRAHRLVHQWDDGWNGGNPLWEDFADWGPYY